MKRHFVLFATIAITVSIVAAADLQSGYYEAEATVDMTFSGTGWVQVVDGDYSVMESSVIDDEVSFSFIGSSVVVYRELLVSGDATVEICIDDLCNTFTSNSTSEQRHIPIAYAADGDSPHSLILTNTDGGLFRFDAVLVMPEHGELAQVFPPDASIQFIDVNGRVAAIDYRITGGDIAVLFFLAFIAMVNVSQIVIARWQKA